MKSVKNKLMIILTVFTVMCSCTLTAFAAMTADQISQQMAQNSAAWHHASPEEQERLHQENVQLGQQLAQMQGGSYTFDDATGQSVITNSSGNTIYQNVDKVASYTNQNGNIVNHIPMGDTTTITNAAGSTVISESIIIIESDANGNELSWSTDKLFASNNGNIILTQSGLIAEAQEELAKQGIEANEYNIGAYINEHHLGTTIAISAENNGITFQFENWYGGETIRVDASGIEGKEILISQIVNMVNGESRGEELWDIWDKINEIEMSDEIQDLKRQYAEVQAMSDDKISPEEKQALLDSIHQQAEDIRAESGYSGGSDGGYYIPFENPGSSPIQITPTFPTPSTPGTNPGTNPDPSDPGPDGGNTNPQYSFWPITVTHSAGGSVTPGSGAFLQGTDALFKFNCEEGYRVKSVTVDGKNIGALDNYSFINISSAHTLHVEFSEEPTLNIDDPVISSDNASSDGTIKAGYGIETSVGVDSDNVTDVVVKASWDFGQGQTGSATLEKGSDGKWHFPVNPESVTGARKIYIPVETLDGVYYVYFWAEAKDSDGNVVKSDMITVRIVVKGTMYEDDFTGDNN